MRYLFLYILLFTSQYSFSAIYECKDSNGNTSYQDHSCKKNEKGSEIGPPSVNSPLVDAKENWTIIDQVDDMTNQRSCVIESPSAYLGRQGSDFLFATIRVTITNTDQFVVALYSSVPLSDDMKPPSFHNDIYGLGLKIDNNQFIEVDLKINSRVIGFNSEKSNKIVSEILKGNKASIRVRFWPYDETFDGRNISLWDFQRALDALKTCKGRHIN